MSIHRGPMTGLHFGQGRVVRHTQDGVTVTEHDGDGGTPQHDGTYTFAGPVDNIKTDDGDLDVTDRWA